MKKDDRKKHKQSKMSTVGMICGLMSMIITVGAYFYIIRIFKHLQDMVLFIRRFDDVTRDTLSILRHHVAKKTTTEIVNFV